MVLAAVALRALLERHWDQAQRPDDTRAQLLAWLKGAGIAGELEQPEREILQTPVGRVDAKLAAAASWRVEGLAVLAWALKRFALRNYDEAAPNALDAAHSSVGFRNPESAREILDSAALRPSTEIDRFASHITVVGWRLQQFILQPGPMDFVGYLRTHPFFKNSWLEELRLVDGDLAIGAQAIADASLEQVQACYRIAIERCIAAYWLQGDNPRYSQVIPSTILSAC